MVPLGIVELGETQHLFTTCSCQLGYLGIGLWSNKNLNWTCSWKVYVLPLVALAKFHHLPSLQPSSPQTPFTLLSPPILCTTFPCSKPCNLLIIIMVKAASFIGRPQRIDTTFSSLHTLFYLTLTPAYCDKGGKSSEWVMTCLQSHSQWVGYGVWTPAHLTPQPRGSFSDVPPLYSLQSYKKRPAQWVGQSFFHGLSFQ